MSGSSFAAGPMRTRVLLEIRRRPTRLILVFPLPHQRSHIAVQDNLKKHTYKLSDGDFGQAYTSIVMASSAEVVQTHKIPAADLQERSQSPAIKAVDGESDEAATNGNYLNGLRLHVVTAA